MMHDIWSEDDYWNPKFKNLSPYKSKRRYPISRTHVKYVESITDVEYFEDGEDLPEKREYIDRSRYDDKCWTEKDNLLAQKVCKSLYKRRNDQNRYDEINKRKFQNTCNKRQDRMYERAEDQFIDKFHAPLTRNISSMNSRYRKVEPSYHGKIDSSGYNDNSDGYTKNVSRYLGKQYVCKQDNNAYDASKHKVTWKFHKIPDHEEFQRPEPHLPHSSSSLDTSKWETPYNNSNFVRSQVNRPLRVHIETEPHPSEKWEINYDNRNFVKSQINENYGYHRRVDNTKCHKYNEVYPYHPSYESLSSRISQLNLKNIDHLKKAHQGEYQSLHGKTLHGNNIVNHSCMNIKKKQVPRKIKFTLREKSSELSLKTEEEDYEDENHFQMRNKLKNQQQNKYCVSPNSGMKIESTSSIRKGRPIYNKTSHDNTNSNTDEWYRRHDAKDRFRNLQKKFDNSKTNDNQERKSSHYGRYPEEQTIYSYENSFRQHKPCYNNNAFKDFVHKKVENAWLRTSNKARNMPPIERRIPIKLENKGFNWKTGDNAHNGQTLCEEENICLKDKNHLNESQEQLEQSSGSEGYYEFSDEIESNSSDDPRHHEITTFEKKSESADGETYEDEKTYISTLKIG